MTAHGHGGAGESAGAAQRVDSSAPAGADDQAELVRAFLAGYWQAVQDFAAHVEGHNARRERTWRERGRRWLRWGVRQRLG